MRRPDVEYMNNKQRGNGSVPILWKVIFGIIVAVMLLIIINQPSRREPDAPPEGVLRASPEKIRREVYSPKWQEGVHREIAIALGRKKARGCGSFQWRRAGRLG
jgi:hypothetical protein